jgi:hypothetical protein
MLVLPEVFLLRFFGTINYALKYFITLTLSYNN